MSVRSRVGAAQGAAAATIRAQAHALAGDLRLGLGAFLARGYPGVYRKTPKGQSEIETRASRLLPRLRQALILVDGKRTDVELAQMIFAEPKATLVALLADGFIEEAAVLPDGAPERESAAPRKAPAGAGSEARRREAVRFLNDQLGPAAEGMALKLERAQPTELRPLLVSAAQVLGTLRGAAAAQAFSARFLAEETV